MCRRRKRVVGGWRERCGLLESTRDTRGKEMKCWEAIDQGCVVGFLFFSYKITTGMVLMIKGV